MEAELIHWLRKRLPDHPRLRLGPGDDAAILRWSGGADCVVTSDLLTDGVDFELQQCDPTRVGRKALAVNLSDLAAMAARPMAAVVSLALPRQGGKELALRLYEGMLPLAEQFDLPIAGGDTNSWPGSLVVSITAIGQVTDRGPLLRGGAQVGDQIIVTGSFGGSMAGKHFDFSPRVAEALRLHAGYRLHAGIDVSDGLSLDLDHLARESGCGAAVDLAAVPIAPAAYRLAKQQSDGPSALDRALSDGEDFELILAVGADEARRLLDEQPLQGQPLQGQPLQGQPLQGQPLQGQPLDVPLTRIGEFIDREGLWSIDAAGELQPLAAQGYQHRLES